MMALMPSAPSHDAPAAAAPTPQTNPNGARPTHAGSISANPARKSEEASSRRIEDGLRVRERRPGQKKYDLGGSVMVSARRRFRAASGRIRQRESDTEARHPW